MFSRKKTARSRPSDPPVLRGRESASAREKDNPLARRFHADDEPDTVDLENPSSFHARPVEQADPPTTQYFDEHDAAADPGASNFQGVLSRDPETGKFYAQPGRDDAEILLNGHAVSAATELRPGDRIDVGGAEFLFRAEAES